MKHPTNLLLPSALLMNAIFFSCAKETYTNRNPQFGNKVDTTVISPSSYIDKTINVGETVTNRPLSSQIFDCEGITRYALLDEDKIFVFNWETGDIADSIPLGKVGTLNNYSGFTLHSPDSLFVYSYPNKMVYLLDEAGGMIKRWALGDYKEKCPDVEAINRTRIIVAGKTMIMSGAIMADIQDSKVTDCTTTIALRHDTLASPVGIMEYPELYKKANWGGVYMNSVYHADAGGGKVFFSFPIDHDVHCYDMSTGKISEFYMGSVYAEGIESCDDNFIESFADRDSRVKYYLGQHSYGVILFDKYRKRLIRIAEHPTDELGKDGIFAKPFSVIVSDMNGKLLYESPIFHDALTYDLYNIHIVPEGLAIAIQDDKNENEIRYRCIEIK